MRRLSRFISAIVLVALYAMIVMSPLAPLALRSPVGTHAITGECASDCSICGCSPDRSANHTCCCWQKRHLHEPDDDPDEPECCRNNHGAKNAKTMISSRPCNSTKNLAFFGAGQSELLPSHFSLDNLVIFEASLYTHIPVSISDWPGNPPDPPPKLSRTI